MQPAPNLPSLIKKLNVPVAMVTEARAFRMVDEALYKAREEQAEMLNERASQLELLKYKNKRFRQIIVNLKKKNESLDLECEKYLDRIDRLKSALRERTVSYDSLQLRHMDLTTANENLKLRLARKSRPNTAGSRRSRRSKSPPNSRPVSANVVAGLTNKQGAQEDGENKSRLRPKSAGSLSSSSRSTGSLRPSSAGSLRPSSAGSLSSGGSSSSSKKVAFANFGNEKDLRPGSGHSVLSPVKEIREEDDEEGGVGEEKEKDVDKSSDEEEIKTQDADDSPEDNSDDDSSSSEGNEDDREKDANERHMAQVDGETKYSEDNNKNSIEENIQKNADDIRPYTADAVPSALEDPYVREVLEARPMTAPEIGGKDTKEGVKHKKRRIAFPKRVPKRVAKIREPPKKKRRDPNEELSELEIIKKNPEAVERDELEDLYLTWGGKRWYLLLLVQGIQCEANKIHRHACSGTSIVGFFIFGAIRFYCFFTISGFGLAISDVAFIFLGLLGQYAVSHILYRDDLLKRLILFMVNDKGRDYFGRIRFKWCIYILPWTIGFGSSIVYNILFISETSSLSPIMFALSLISVPFSIFFSQIVWHAIGLYVFMQLSLSAYIMEKEYITRDLENHVQTFYKVRCMVDDATRSLGRYLCDPIIPICAIGVSQNILELYFVDNPASSFIVMQVFNYGLGLVCLLYFGGFVNQSCEVICTSLSSRMITSIEDDEKKLKLKARMGALGDDDPTTLRLDKHQKFPLLLFDLTLSSSAKNLSLMYSYVSNRTEMGFKFMGIMLQQLHGLLVGIIILSVIINGGGH